MTKHLQKDLDKLREKIVVLGNLVEEATEKATKIVETFDLALVDEIVETESIINEMEVDIEEDCLKTLALHQPVAIDLRFLIVVLKVNNDLERMGDQTVNIAQRVKFLSAQDRIAVDLDFKLMGSICRKMVHNALTALVRQDVEMAQEILRADEELDALHARTYKVLQDAMASNSSIVSRAVSYLTISSNLERIGDLATNIAEEIIFMEQGEVIRHRPDD